jgi:cytoskeleton protein RodZ
VIGAAVLQDSRSKLAQGRSWDRNNQSRKMMSSNGFESPDTSDASRVGVDLRAARERLGWGLTECADSLRIRREYLVALEEGQFGAMPGPAYAAGFLRSYGRSLGLDADELVRRFKAEALRGSSPTRLSFPVPAPERGLPTGAMVLLGLVLAVGAYAGWYRLSGEGRLPAEVVAAIPSRLASLADQAVPLPPPPAGKTAKLDSDIPEPGEAPQAPSSISPSSAAAAIPLPPVPNGAPPPPLMQAMVSPPMAATPPPQIAADASRLLLKANGDAWLQVRDRAGQVLLRKVLKAGETWPVPPKPGLLLTTGNSTNTEVVLDGSQVIALSGSGISRRDMPLDLDLIKDGKLAPPLVVPKPRPPPVATGADAAYVPPGSR